MSNSDSLSQLSAHGARTNSLRHMQITLDDLIYQRENAATGFPYSCAVAWWGNRSFFTSQLPEP